MLFNRKTLSGTALGLLAVLFVALVLISNLLLRGARLDLTENSLYTLSSGTQNILSKLDEPLHLSLYFSDKATADSNMSEVRNLRVYYNRVRELLEEMSSQAGSKLVLDFIDPLPYSEDEDRAAAAGVQGIPVGSGGEKIFLGLTGSNSTDGQSVIPFFDPGKEEFLEYDLAKLIHSLTVVKKPVVALLSGLDITAGFDPTTQRIREDWAIYQQLTQAFDVKPLDSAALKSIDADVKVLVVIHPKNLSDDAQYAIDQFVLRGGHLLAFVDPHAEFEEVSPDPMNPMGAMTANKDSDLPKLFKAWGIEYSPKEVVLDRVHALAITTHAGMAPTRHPGILHLTAKDIVSNDVVTGNMDNLHIATSGYLKLNKDSQAKLTPLLETGDQAMTVSTDRIKLTEDPSTLLKDFAPTGEHYVMAARLQGKFKTAFPERNEAGHLAESKEATDMIIMADTDFLNNKLWVEVQDFFGQKLLNTFASNGDFFINAVDNLSGSSDLISIRGRGKSSRPFTTVEELKLMAEDRFQSKEQELEQELLETERKLAELQSNKSKDQKMVLSPEQQKELENFLQRKVEIRKQLRDVRRQLDADIDSLGASLKFLNIALIPILLTLGSLGYSFWKSKQRSTTGV